jgi:hypothetical protein
VGPGEVAAQEAAAGSLIWPARADPGVTSSFGEYRAGHVHAGLDIKTWGRVGVPMLAVRDGRVMRVRTSPWGYGKAVYLALEDGRTAVYAHLDRFSPEIEELVQDRQLQEGSYTVDIWLDGDAMPVEEGAVIAYSGMTGTAAPHLHFEMRDRNNAPVNPLTSGLNVEDSIPPVVRYLVLRPVGTAARLEGSVRVRRFGVRSQGNGEYTLRGRPELQGVVAFSVVSHDMMDGVWNRFAPYRMVLEVDGREVFRVQYDQFTYDVSGLVDLDRDWRYMVREGIRAHTLYRQVGNALPFYGEYGEGEGYVRNLTPGVHEIHLTVADVVGNESHLRGELLVNRPPGVDLATELVERIVPGDEEISAADTTLVVAQLRGEVHDPDGDQTELHVEAYFPGELEADNAPDGTLPAGGSWRQVAQDSVTHSGDSFAIAEAYLDDLREQGAVGLRLRTTDSWDRSAYSHPVALAVVREFGSAGELDLHVEHYESFLILTIRDERGIPGEATFQVRQGELPVQTMAGRQARRHSYVAIYPLRAVKDPAIVIQARLRQIDGISTEETARLHLQPLPASGSSLFRSEDGRLEIEFPRGTFYHDSFLADAPSDEPVLGDSGELIPLSMAYELGPRDIQFRGQGLLKLDLEDLPVGIRDEQVGLYTRTTRNGTPRWVYIGGALSRGGGDAGSPNMLEAAIGGFGPFAAMADTARPELTLVSPRDGSRLRSARPRIEFRLEDRQTGFSEGGQLVMRLNGAQVIAEYDPFRDRLVFVPRQELEPGDYFLTLDAVDNAGNRALHTSRFTIRQIENPGG